MIHHVALAADWHEALSTGTYRVGTAGLTLDEVGYVHAAFEEQLDGVLRRYYDGTADDLVLLVVDEGDLTSTVVVEAVPGSGESYPHVYGPIPVAAVRSVVPLARDGHGRVLLPRDLGPTAP